VTGYGPPDDPSDAPTGYIDYGDSGGYGQQEPEPGPPWYRKPAVLLGLGLLAAILVALAIYVIADRTKGGGGSTPTSTSPTSAGVTTTATTPPPPSSATTTEPVAPAPTTTLTYPPASTSIDDGHHHHRHHDDGGTP
jgi:hypothetical protein